MPSPDPLPKKLVVRAVSGEEVLALQRSAFMETVGPTDSPLQCLKCILQGRCGQPRFRQRLLLSDGTHLLDEHLLQGAVEALLVALTFQPASHKQASELMDAAGSNDVAKIEKLLHLPQDPDEMSFELGRRPFFVSCQRGHEKAARLLLEARAELDRADDHGVSPLSAACLEGHAGIVSMLLEAKADQDRANVRGSIPLLRACSHGHLAVVQLLLEAGADKDWTGEVAHGRTLTPLAAASFRGFQEIVRVLLAARADANKVDSRSLTPLMLVPANGDSEIARILLEAKADMSKQCHRGATALHFASIKGCEDIVHVLLEAEADANLTDTRGRTPLMTAILLGQTSTVRILCAASKEVSAKRLRLM